MGTPAARATAAYIAMLSDSLPVIEALAEREEVMAQTVELPDAIQPALSVRAALYPHGGASPPPFSGSRRSRGPMCDGRLVDRAFWPGDRGRGPLQGGER